MAIIQAFGNAYNIGKCETNFTLNLGLRGLSGPLYAHGGCLIDEIRLKGG